MPNQSYPKGFYEFFTEQPEHNMRSHYIDNLSFLSHMHVQIEIVYVLDGEVFIEIDDKKQILSSGSVAFIAPHKIHSFHTDTSSHCILSIFSPILIPEIDHILKKLQPLQPFISATPHTLALVQHFKGLVNAINHSDILMAKGHLSIILASIMNDLDFQEVSSPDNYMIQTLLHYIYTHYQEQISLDSISAHLGISKFYISHLFNKEIGCSLSNYINYLRVNRAKQLLFTDQNITDIAYECGFDSLRSFYRCFSKFCNTTPLKYRKEH